MSGSIKVLSSLLCVFIHVSMFEFKKIIFNYSVTLLLKAISTSPFKEIKLLLETSVEVMTFVLKQVHYLMRSTE